MGIDNYLETATHTDDDVDNSTADNNEESDDDEPEISPPNARDMEAAFQTLQNYAATNDVDDSFMDNLNYMKRHFFVKKRQTNILDYFKHN